MPGTKRRGGTCRGHRRRAATRPGAQAAPSLRVAAGPGIFFAGAPRRAPGTASPRLREPAPAWRATRKEPTGGRTPSRKASPPRRGVLDVLRRRERAKPDAEDGPTPPAQTKGGGQVTRAQEGAPSEAGQKRKGHGEKSPLPKARPLVGLLEPWPVRLLAATTWRRAFAVCVGNLWLDGRCAETHEVRMGHGKRRPDRVPFRIYRKPAGG
jgi:hypothetical protein